MKKRNTGSTFDRWLREEGIFQEVSASTAKRIAARHDEDLRRINDAADDLNSEAAVAPGIPNSGRRRRHRIRHPAYPANLAANASTSAPTMMRYTANGAKPRLRT
jgi:hypothetical protein